MGNISAGSIDAPAVLPYTLAAEINFQAFDVSSTDYHNALYGYIEAEGWKNDYDGHQVKVNYTKLNKNGTTSNLQISKTEKIRHIIHHPENRNNSYSEQELKDSIECMRNYIRAHRTIWYKILKFLKQNELWQNCILPQFVLFIEITICKMEMWMWHLPFCKRG